MFILVKTQQQLSEHGLRLHFPHISFPAVMDDAFLALIGCARIHRVGRPQADVVIELAPIQADGKWYQQWEARDYNEQELVELIEQAKAEALARVNEGYIQAVSALEADYPASERESWHVQVDEARRLVEGDTDTPWIDAAAQARGIARDELAQLIMTQDGQYRAIHGQLTGHRQALRDQIYALTGSDRETWQALTRLGWSESNE